MTNFTLRPLTLRWAAVAGLVALTGCSATTNLACNDGAAHGPFVPLTAGCSPAQLADAGMAQHQAQP